MKLHSLAQIPVVSASPDSDLCLHNSPPPQLGMCRQQKDMQSKDSSHRLPSLRDHTPAHSIVQGLRRVVWYVLF